MRKLTLSFEQALKIAQEILCSEFTISMDINECSEWETIQFEDKEITITYSTGGSWVTVGNQEEFQYCPLDWEEEKNKPGLEIKALVEKRLKEMGVKSSFFY